MGKSRQSDAIAQGILIIVAGREQTYCCIVLFAVVRQGLLSDSVAMAISEALSTFACLLQV